MSKDLTKYVTTKQAAEMLGGSARSRESTADREEAKEHEARLFLAYFHHVDQEISGDGIEARAAAVARSPATRNELSGQG